MKAIAAHSDLLAYQSYLANGPYGVICHTSAHLHAYPLHRHDYIEVEYLAQGKMEHELNGTATMLDTGDCYGLGLHDLHRFRVIDPVIFHNLCISPSQTTPAVRQLLLEQPFPFCGTLSPGSLTQVNVWFAALCAQLRAPAARFAEARVTALLLLILTEIFSVSQPAPESESGCSRYVRDALDWVTAHYAEPITLNQLAAAVHLSPCYLSALFSEQVGCPFVSYLTRVRVEKAQKQLACSDTPITQIALDCGFGSFSAFTRAFRRLTGCSAQEFRAHLHT